MQITDIYWERIYLHIKIDGKNAAENQYILMSRDNTKSCPLCFNEQTGELVLNITNAEHQQMLSNDDWFIMHRADEKEEWKLLTVSLEVCRNHSRLDKIYWYGEGNYAYAFSVVPFLSEDRQTCFIRSAFMKPNFHPERRYIHNKKAPLKRKIHSLLTDFAGKILNLIYQLLSHLNKKSGKRILLMSENRAMGGNIKALDERLRSRGLDEKFEISYHFAQNLNLKGIKLFAVWLKLVVLCAVQDYIFIDDYEPFFEHINLHPKTKLIQVWHAGVGFKSVGYARFGEEGSCHPFVSSHRKYDKAIVGGESLKKVYAEVFGIDEDRCLPFGLMRNDGYRDEEKISSFKEHFFAEYPHLANKKIILFAPTFRGDSIRTAHYPDEFIDMKKIYDMCGEEYAFLIKMHPFIQKKAEIDECFTSRIFDFSEYPDINELFYVSDILITDFSSSIYEFAMLNKPMLFYAPDKEAYETQRSLHRSLEEYAPGRICRSLDDVALAIKTEDFELCRLEKFVRENFSQSDGFAADKVIDTILLS